MTFEEELQRAVDALADRLRREAAEHLQGAMADLRQAAQAERVEAVAAAVRETREAADRDASERLAAVEHDAAHRLETVERDAAARLDEAERVAAERTNAAERAATERAEAAERAGAERADTAERAAAERAEVAERAAAERVEAAGRAAAERVEALERDAAERVEAAERAATDRVETITQEVTRRGETAEREAAAQLAFAQRDAAEQLAAAVQEAESRAHEAGRADGRKEGIEEGLREGRKEGWNEGLKEGRETGTKEGAQEGVDRLERLADAVRDMDNAPSLSGILDALGTAAGREAACVALFLVQGQQLRSWKCSGCGPALDSASPFDLSMADAGLIAEAIGSAQVRTANSSQDGLAPGFASCPAGRTMLAVPMIMSGEVVGVLYGHGDPTSGHPAWPAALEILARHAARELETVTAFRTASLLINPAPGSPMRAAGGGSEGERRGSRSDVGAFGDEDQEAARRYARLLISEIKLYHETEVLAGRHERDLASRLGGEIARARALYEQRVPPQVRAGTDHFRAELVKTLADGDSALFD